MGVSRSPSRDGILSRTLALASCAAKLLLCLGATSAAAQNGGYNPSTWTFDSENGVLVQPGAPAPTDVPAENREWAEIPKRVVVYAGGEAPGTIIVDTSARHLDLVLTGKKALRYAVGVGRDGFAWSGRNRVSAKKQWPDWRPPAEMIARARAEGRDMQAFVPGGHNNPLGARALYIGSTLYRIHGTNEPWTVGTATSSGCIRLTNEDVADLYERVPVGANVIVRN